MSEAAINWQCPDQTLSENLRQMTNRAGRTTAAGQGVMDRAKLPLRPRMTDASRREHVDDVQTGSRGRRHDDVTRHLADVLLRLCHVRVFYLVSVHIKSPAQWFGVTITAASDLRSCGRPLHSHVRIAIIYRLRMRKLFHLHTPS